MNDVICFLNEFEKERLILILITHIYEVVNQTIDVIHSRSNSLKA